jgi:hypothetical protein
LASLLVVPSVVCAAPVRAQTAEGRAVARPAVERSEQPVEHPWGGPQSQLVWFDAQAGVEMVQMQTFVADFYKFSAGLLPARGVGPDVNVGAGIRLGFVTLGLRGEVASFEDRATVGSWQIWTLNGELGVRVPLDRVEPHIELAAGYASVGGFGTAIRGLSDGLDVHGADFRMGLGVDYWVAHQVSVGLAAAGEALAVARPGVSLRDLATAKQIGTLNDAEARVLEANGSSVGFGLSLTGALAAHF